MFESIINFFKKFGKQDNTKAHSKDAAKERLHLVLMQDRANVSADFLDLMKQEIIEVIKKYIDVDENEIDVRLANKTNEDGTTGAPALYANIPIISIKEEAKKGVVESVARTEEKQDKNKDDVGAISNRPETKSEDEVKEEINTDNNEDDKKEEKIEENEDDVGAISNHPETKSEDEVKEEINTDNNEDNKKEEKDKSDTDNNDNENKEQKEVDIEAKSVRNTEDKDPISPEKDEDK